MSKKAMIMLNQIFKNRFLLPGILVFLSGFMEAQHPFKFDSLYNTIYAKELCQLIQRDPDVVLIDVRSAGEFCDTSQYASLNKGHLKGAINIPVDSIKNNINILAPYKDKTVILYCSHSQRSRRMSKLLSENGYTNHYNLNGGMTSLNELNNSDFPCQEDLIVSLLKFKVLSFDKTVDFIKKEKQAVIIDVRPAIQYEAKDTVAENNVGRIKGAINIPYDQFPNRINELAPYKNRPVLIYTASGDGDGARAATELVNNGYTKVHLLLSGINDFIASGKSASLVENKMPFNTINSYSALQLLKGSKKLVVFDTRTRDAYNSELVGKMDYMNLGHINNAIHVDKPNWYSFPLTYAKNTPILVYGNEEAMEFALYLYGQGYKRVFLLSSYYNFVWAAFNEERCKDIKQFLTDHSGLY